MAKNDEPEPMVRGPPRRGMMIAGAFLLMIGMLGGAYLLSMGDYAPKVTVNPASPNVYVSNSPEDHTISVSADATQNVAPDLLLIDLSVKTDDTTAAQSQSDNAAVVADLMTKLEAQGLTQSDIQTVSYDVEPDYNSTYVCDKTGANCQYQSTVTGYTTTQEFLLSVKQLDKGGQIIDAASAAGVNQTLVNSVSFTLQDSTRAAVEQSLLENASTEAKADAQNIADGLGVSLGNVSSASESSYYPEPVYNGGVLAAEAPEAAVPTQLSSGQVEVSVTVSASFEVH
jgi:hypothetical protein